MKNERKNLIAVYGTLRQGCGNFRYHLADADFQGSFNSEPVYSMFNLGGFPGLKNNGNTSIFLEVYLVNDEEAEHVDNLEGYEAGREPHFYDKQSIETPWGTAGIYIYVRDTTDRDLVESGDWVKRNERVVYDRMV